MSATRILLSLGLAVACLVVAEAYPQDMVYEEPYPGSFEPEQPNRHQPQIQSRQGYGKPVYGRVKIQTYRGPSKGYGYDAFAPWGYYVTQPEDDKAYGYH